jgi:hypothetical protein
VSFTKLDKLHGLTDSGGNPLQFSQTHRLPHTRATELLNDGVPIQVVQRYLGHALPEMTLRYAATLAATAEAEFLKHKKIGAHGVDIAICPADILDMSQLSARTDRVLPNGVCLLPPLKSCDKGNACLSCGHFTTDVTHAGELRDQRAKTTALIELRRDQYRQRTGHTRLCCRRRDGGTPSREPRRSVGSPRRPDNTQASKPWTWRTFRTKWITDR